MAIGYLAVILVIFSPCEYPGADIISCSQWYHNCSVVDIGLKSLQKFKIECVKFFAKSFQLNKWNDTPDRLL